MLFLILGLIVLICMILIVIKIIKSPKIKSIKILATFIIIITLFGVSFAGIKIYKQLPHNEVSKDDRLALESYIQDKYGLELKVKESEVIHRGDIGINPGIEYVFVLKNGMGFEYHLNINRYSEMDLKTILKENPDLNLIQMK